MVKCFKTFFKGRKMAGTYGFGTNGVYTITLADYEVVADTNTLRLGITDLESKLDTVIALDSYWSNVSKTTITKYLEDSFDFIENAYTCSILREMKYRSQNAVITYDFNSAITSGLDPYIKVSVVVDYPGWSSPFNIQLNYSLMIINDQ